MLLRSLLVWLCIGAAAARAEPIDANRPGQANPPTVVAPGVLQIESGLQLTRETGRGPDVSVLTLPAPELRLGLFRGVELQLAAAGFVRKWQERGRNRSGGSDLAVDLRTVLWEQAGWRPAAALDLGLSFPTGSDFVTSNGVDPEGELLLGWDFARVWNFTGNLAFSSETQGKGDSTRHFVFSPELALSRSLGARLGAFVEYFADFEESASDQHNLDGGLTWLVSDDLQLDLSAGVGLNDAAPDFFVAAGVSWRLPRLWE